MGIDYTFLRGGKSMWIRNSQAEAGHNFILAITSQKDNLYLQVIISIFHCGCAASAAARSSTADL
jgi:hypothetical protein